MKLKYIFLLFILTKYFSLILAEDTDPYVVRIKSGLIKGFDQEGSMAFLGIPYAKVERFMPPLPVDSWDDVRICDHWGPQAMQSTNMELGEDKMSEKNSCVLNVWTTDVKAKKPVMLWLHGGGFDFGSAEWDPGMSLAKKDVVVVSINHRLNILGFLDLSTVSEKYKYSGNVGMLDIVAALEWVRDNIKQFGGDPDNVTVFGESGGGGKVGTLLCMPPAKGLFHKAIILSGTLLVVNTKSMTEELGKAVLKELGISNDNIEKINDIQYKDLYNAGQKAMKETLGTWGFGTPMMFGFCPTPDGEILLNQPFMPGFSEISNNVPIKIGTTFNELQTLSYSKPMKIDDARNILSNTFEKETDSYIKAFSEAYPDYTPQDLVSIDWLFRPKTLVTADAIGDTREADTYMYMFMWKSPVSGGSCHGAELKFVFDSVQYSQSDLPDPTEEDFKLADIMSSSWAQFAHTGDPNIDELPTWKPYNAENGETMIFDYNCRVRNNPDRKLEEIIHRYCFKELEEYIKNHE